MKNELLETPVAQIELPPARQALPSESTHWYDKKGNPVYEVEAKKGGMRPTTLADARKLDLVPSVTNILNVAAKPGLEAWKAKQILEASLTLPRIYGETLDDYSVRVMEDAKAQGKKAAERGTELHKAIEDYICGKWPAEWKKHLIKVEDTLRQYGIDIFIGTAEHSFSSPLGYGGKLDWHNDKILIDFKTKDTVKDKKQLAWPEHCWQLAAYANGISETLLNHRRLINVFVGVDDCEVRIHEWTPEDDHKGWEAFKCLLNFWKITKNFGASEKARQT